MHCAREYVLRFKELKHTKNAESGMAVRAKCALKNKLVEMKNQ